MWMEECGSCRAASSGSFQTWISHLADVHAVPTEWPSARVSRLSGLAATKPYTTVTATKKKRNDHSIPRPLNSFMLFAQHIRRNVLGVFNYVSNSEISRKLGEAWGLLPRVLKHQYDEEATRLSRIHLIEFPGYKYQPKKRFHSDSQQSSAGFFSQSSSQSSGTSSSHVSSSPNLNQHYLSPVADCKFQRLRQRYASATNGEASESAAIAFQPPVRASSCLILTQPVIRQPPPIERIVPVFVKCGDTMSHFNMSLPVEQPPAPMKQQLMFLIPVEVEVECDTTLVEVACKNEALEEISIDQTPFLFDSGFHQEIGDNGDVFGSQFDELIKSIDINEILDGGSIEDFREEEKEREEFCMDMLNLPTNLTQLLQNDLDSCISNILTESKISV